MRNNIQEAIDAILYKEEPTEEDFITLEALNAEKYKGEESTISRIVVHGIYSMPENPLGLYPD